MEAWRADANLFRDRVYELTLAEWPIVGDVVDLTYRLTMVERQKQALNDVGDVHERKCVVPRADDDPSASAKSVRHSREMQLVAGTKEGARPNNYSRQALLGDHALHR